MLSHSPHCSSEPPLSYHVFTETLVLKYLSFLIDFTGFGALRKVVFEPPTIGKVR